jgi:cobalt/nickel transport system permease protein
LLGAALVTILLGPWAGILTLTCVVGIQALIFQDGGILALGANLFNMGVVGVAVAYAVYRFFQWIARGQKWGIFVGGFAAAWSSIFIASLAAALQLAFSGTSPANVAVPAMAGIHALIGIGEGLITVGALALIYAARRDLLKLGEAQPAGSKIVLVGGALLAILLAVLSPLASAFPDGLEWVAGQNGFIGQAQEPLYSIIPDYAFPGISNEAVATIIAGIFGTIVVLGLALFVAHNRKKSHPLS